MIVAFVLRFLIDRLRGRDSVLRRCPLCAADAVSASEQVLIGANVVEVRLQCGQCGARRRLVTTLSAARRLDRQLERDRKLLAGQAARLQREHDASDIHTLAREVVGVKDFLALTRRSGAGTDAPRRGSSA
jgi:hypothetical protein